MNSQGWFPLGLTGFISLQSKGLSSVFCSTIIQKHQFFSTQPSLASHLYMTAGKNIALTIQIFVRKVMSLLFNTLSRLVIAFLTRNKRLLISWLRSPCAVILEPKKRKSVTVSTSSANSRRFPYISVQKRIFPMFAKGLCECTGAHFECSAMKWQHSFNLYFLLVQTLKVSQRWDPRAFTCFS